MRKINISQVSETEQHSPKGRFAVFRKHISVALGGLKDVGVFGGGHPFDLELVRVPSGRAAWPLHSHSAQWELYLIISGSGQVRTASGIAAVGVGDVIIHPPEEAHQLRNTGSDDLVYYVIADHALADVVHYPDSGKWFTKPQRKSFRMLEADYYDGEE
jgi:uncharacterized cupin superfamily protein